MMLRTSLLDTQLFVAVGGRTGIRHIIRLDTPKDPAKPHARYNLKTVDGEEVAALGGGLYLILPTGEILTETALKK